MNIAIQGDKDGLKDVLPRDFVSLEFSDHGKLNVQCESSVNFDASISLVTCFIESILKAALA